MTEEVREALMRLTMCAREECEICKHKDECGYDMQCELATQNMNIVLNALESRPKGEWIEHKNNLDTYYCSKCGTDALYYFGKPFGEYSVFQVKSEFCPCCGADMRGGE